MASERLEESTRVWILQMALNKVNRGKEPDVEMSDAERASYERTVNELKLMKEAVGPEKFSEMTFDVSYDA